jgi:hypothetical protein
MTEVVACATTCRNAAALIALGLELADLLAQKLITSSRKSRLLLPFNLLPYSQEELFVQRTLA